MDLYSRVWCVFECYLAIKKSHIEPDFTIEAIGLQGEGQSFDMAWLLNNYPDDVQAYCMRRNGVAKQFRDGLMSREEALEKMDCETTSLAEEYGRRWATEFVEKTPRCVADAQASVEKDREDIMKVIFDLQED